MSYNRDAEEPSWIKPCDNCGAEVERWPGEAEVNCPSCRAEYNAFGQRLRDNWRGNRSWDDEEVDDLEGYELSELAREDTWQ